MDSLNVSSPFLPWSSQVLDEEFRLLQVDEEILLVQNLSLVLSSTSPWEQMEHQEQQEEEEEAAAAHIP